MVNYWLCVTNEKNWEVIKQRRLWGVSERNRGKIERVRPGDFLIFYVKPKKILGIFKATTKQFKSGERIFDSTGFSEDEIFPYRIKLQPFALPENPIPIEKLIPELTFIISKRMWPGYFRKAMQAIPKEDFELVHSWTKNL